MAGGRAPRRDGALVAEMVESGEPSSYESGQRIFHQKFGYGRIVAVDGNKLDIEFDKAGRKKVLDSFVAAA